MGEAREYTLEELRQIVGDIAAAYGMKRVYLIGSRARRDNGDDSGNDLCVLHGGHCCMFDLGGFITDLKESLGRDVDIVYEDCIGDDFLEAVMEEGKLLYEEREAPIVHPSGVIRPSRSPVFKASRFCFPHLSHGF